MLKRLQGWLVPAAAVGLWASADALGLLQHRALAGPWATAHALITGLQDGPLLGDVAATMARAVVSVLLALLPAVVTGLWIGASRRQTRLWEPALDFVRSVPPLLVLPLFLLGLGYGNASRIAVATWAATWVMALVVAAGARQGHPERDRFLRAMGATHWQRLRWLRAFEVLPHGFVALRQGLATSLVVTVVTEMLLGAPQGLGARAMGAQIAYNTPLLYAVILLTGALGFAGAEIILAMERRWVFWTR